LIFGFSNEFMDRGDGWPGLRSTYGLPHKNVSGMDHDLAYRGLEGGSVHVIDLYTTDAEIDYYGLQTLEDDLHYFPVYTAVLLYRADLEERAPDIVAALKKLEGRISEPDMIKMNELAKIKKVDEAKVAADFLAEHFSLKNAVAHETMAGRVWRHTKEHLYLVSISLLAAILISIPLGIIAERKSGLGQIILSIVGIIQTIPSLALLVFMIPLLGIGGPPAIAALFLYSLLPVVRNTYTGLRDIPPPVRESAEALGLPPGAKLRLVELPMASRAILAGIKTSAVINVGTATLGALIGAGGYGQPILTGIRLDDVGLILQGAIPAALLALLVQGLFELAELVVVPKGLRLKPLA
jgi:osmoprotectant transport system permease protein